MSDNIVWIVDEDASADEAPALAARVREWLVAERIVAPGPGEIEDGTLLLRRGDAAPAWDTFPCEWRITPCGLEVSVGRRVFHTGGNGIDGIGCPACGAVHGADDLPWSDAVEAWLREEGDDAMACGTCGARRGIAEWAFEMPWGFGHLAFGFWNWPVGERLRDEVARLTGHRCRLVYEHI